MGATIAILVFIAFAAIVAAALVVNRLICIAKPNEVLVFTGPTRNRADGVKVGYRVVARGGRRIRIPLLERVDSLNLENMVIDIRVADAFSKGGIPLSVEGVANIKIASREPILGNAVERLLGKDKESIQRIARETLEGNLRGVLATLTPEEVNDDRQKFAESLTEEADLDLEKLGLDLDNLKIQNVADSVGYLDSLGRKQSADLKRRARIAEANNQAESAVRSAENLQTQELARIDAEMKMAKADADKRIIDAQTKKSAMVAEQLAWVQAEVAKANAELDVQRARLEQVRLQLEADQIQPAEAARQQAIERARGASAAIVEDGKATAESLRRLAETWAASGDNARQVVVAQKLTGLVRELMSTVSSQPIDKFTVIDSELNGNGGNLAVKAAVTSEQLKQTIGVDLPAILRRLEGSNGASGSATPPPLPKSS